MDQSEHKAVAIERYNRCWDLLETPDRTADQDVELMTAAYTSRYHWIEAGGDQQVVIAEWMVSRAAAVLGYGNIAVDYALRAVAGSEGRVDWMQASAAEGLARAYDAAGEKELKEQWRAKAQELVDAIEEDEERAVIAEQLASLP